MLNPPYYILEAKIAKDSTMAMTPRDIDNNIARLYI